MFLPTIVGSFFETQINYSVKYNMNKGFIDAPASEDKFEIKNYIDGISKFILTCNTPMTMSIQGDWGTGKTSIMKMLLVIKEF